MSDVALDAGADASVGAGLAEGGTGDALAVDGDVEPGHAGLADGGVGREAGSALGGSRAHLAHGRGYVDVVARFALGAGRVVAGTALETGVGGAAHRALTVLQVVAQCAAETVGYFVGVAAQAEGVLARDAGAVAGGDGVEWSGAGGAGTVAVAARAGSLAQNAGSGGVGGEGSQTEGAEIGGPADETVGH